MQVSKSGVSSIYLISLVFAAVACSHSSSVADVLLLPPSIQSKLDPKLLHRLEELSNLGRLDESLRVLIRTASEINLDQENLLKSRGVIIHSKFGVILSAIIPAGSIQDVAALEFVLRIELARKLKKREDRL